MTDESYENVTVPIENIKMTINVTQKDKDGKIIKEVKDEEVE